MQNEFFEKIKAALHTTKVSPLAIAGLIILASITTIILSFELQKDQRVYKSKAAEGGNACIASIREMGSDIENLGVINTGQKFECRVTVDAPGYTDIICGYIVGNSRWPKNCPYKYTDGLTAVFECDPTQPTNDNLPLPQAGDTLYLAAMRGDQVVEGNACKDQWNDEHNFRSGPLLYYIQRPNQTPTSSVPQPSGQTTPQVSGCRDNPVSPPNGYKWTALCTVNCTNNSTCPRGANNQEGWCYGFPGGSRCMRLDSVQTSVTPSQTVSPRVSTTPPANQTPSPVQGITSTVSPTVTPQPTVTATPTVNPTPQPANTTLNLKLRFQGILTNPQQVYNRMNVRIALKNMKNGQNTEFQSIVFQSDSNGVWLGKAIFSVIPNTQYAVYIKGPKHIQKRLCVVSPTESSSGIYRCRITDTGITLQAGENDLNFSNIVMIVGDLPEQDGIVNSYDLARVRNNLGSTNAEALAVADLNLDGAVNARDFSLILAALSFRTDDE